MLFSMFRLIISLPFCDVRKWNLPKKELNSSTENEPRDATVLISAGLLIQLANTPTHKLNFNEVFAGVAQTTCDGVKW